MFRPMRRFKQAVSEEDCRALLQKARRGVLAVNGDNGYPYAVPMNFYFDEEKGSIFFHCAREGHKLDAMLRDEKVCFTVFGGDVKRDDWAWYVTSVVVFGEAQLVTGEAEKNALLRALAKKFFSARGGHGSRYGAQRRPGAGGGNQNPPHDRQTGA